MKTRRDFLKTLGFGALTLVSPKTIPGKTIFQKHPNIIFIMADDLGYADLGCYGQKKIQTPNIDRMSQEGIRFTQCYAGCTVCAPARSVLMTGQHTGHTTVRGNFLKSNKPGEKRRVPLKAEDVTIAEVLKKAGYVTGITGKWGLGEPGTPGIPNKQGFDEWLGYLNQAKAHSYFPPYLWQNQEKLALEGNLNGQRKQYTHDLFTQFALNFIKKHRDKPFFLYLPYTIPHAKYEIPDISPYQDKPWSDQEKIYAAMVSRLDGDVGKILQLLDNLKLSQNTMVFFCSDNGAAKRWEGVFDSSGELRGQKRDMYEGGLRVPMIVRQPGTVPAGEVSEVPWYFADVMPTLAELAGAPCPANIDGISILPIILGKKQKLPDRFMYWEFHERGFQQAVRWRNWKAIRPNLNKKLELYDLKTDPGEQNNIAAEHPEIIQKIESYLKTARSESKEWPLSNKIDQTENF